VCVNVENTLTRAEAAEAPFFALKRRSWVGEKAVDVKNAAPSGDVIQNILRSRTRLTVRAIGRWIQVGLVAAFAAALVLIWGQWRRAATEHSAKEQQAKIAAANAAIERIQFLARESALAGRLFVSPNCNRSDSKNEFV
jgi:hypothetical protein